MAIDIGSPATDRGSGKGPGWTLIALDNPANESGIITDIEIYAQTSITGCKVGTFYGTPNNLTNRDYATIGNVAAGSKQSFSGLSIDCEAGDYIGIFSATGNIEADTSGYAGVLEDEADNFGGGQVSYYLSTGDTISVYGFSVAVVGRSHGYIIG